jgi:hypothetical protein
MADARTEALEAAGAIQRAIEIPVEPNWERVRDSAQWLGRFAAEQMAKSANEDEAD